MQKANCDIAMRHFILLMGCLNAELVCGRALFLLLRTNQCFSMRFRVDGFLNRRHRVFGDVPVCFCRSSCAFSILPCLYFRYALTPATPTDAVVAAAAVAANAFCLLVACERVEETVSLEVARSVLWFFARFAVRNCFRAALPRCTDLIRAAEVIVSNVSVETFA